MGLSLSIGIGMSITKGTGGQPDPLRPLLATSPVLSPVGPNDIGEQIFATSGDWLNSPTFAWSWYRDGVLIAGETGNSYNLVDADGGHIITARITATNAHGTNAASTNDSYAGTVPIIDEYPEITGESELGSILSCSTGTWTMNALTYGFQWLRDGVAISGETSSTYRADSPDIGFEISCEVTASNSWGTSDPAESSNSIFVLDTQIPVIPFNTVPPALSGTAQDGQTLSTTDGTWTGVPPPTFAYQWFADGVEIPGATSSTYVLTSAEIGTNVSVRVTATNASGSVEALSGTTVDVIAGGSLHLSAQTIAENSAIGTTVGTLSVTNVTGSPVYSLDNDGDGKFAIDGADLEVADDIDYDVQTSHTVVVSASGTSPLVPQTSFVITVTDVADGPVNTVLPTISGTVEVFSVLTGTDGTWTGTPTPTLTYQWNAGGVAISGATSSTYQLQTAEDGALITFTVTGTNTAGSVSATSLPTAAVTTFAPALKFNDARNSQYAPFFFR